VQQVTAMPAGDKQRSKVPAAALLSFPQVLERPTVRDVAPLAGVSLKTVSRVIDSVPSGTPRWPPG
jgi:hypothetical protein